MGLLRFLQTSISIGLILLSTQVQADNQCMTNLRGQIGMINIPFANNELGDFSFDHLVGREVGRHMVGAIGIPRTQRFSAEQITREQAMTTLRRADKRIGVLTDMHVTMVPNGYKGFGISLTLNSTIINLADNRFLGGNVTRAEYYNIGPACETAFKEYFNLRTRTEVPSCLTNVLTRSDSTFGLGEPTKNPAIAHGRILREYLRGQCLDGVDAQPDQPETDVPGATRE